VLFLIDGVLSLLSKGFSTTYKNLEKVYLYGEIFIVITAR
jgi:hypothetical protein